MNTRRARYRGHRFPPEIIDYSVWAYHRFALSFRDVEALLAERGIIVSYKSVRRWCLKFRPHYQRSRKRREGQLGDHWYADEVFVNIQVRIHYLWRAVDGAFSPTSSAAIVWPPASSCPERHTIPIDMRTTEWNFRTNRRGSKNARCVASNRASRRNDSYPFTHE